jgi:hypothetical protein
LQPGILSKSVCFAQRHAILLQHRSVSIRHGAGIGLSKNLWQPVVYQFHEVSHDFKIICIFDTDKGVTAFSFSSWGCTTFCVKRMAILLYGSKLHRLLPI